MQLRCLKQTSSVREYTTHFQDIVGQITNMSEMDQLIQYIDGLKPATKTEVSLHAPATLAETITLATRVDYVMWGAGSSKNSGKNGRF